MALFITGPDVAAWLKLGGTVGAEDEAILAEIAASVSAYVNRLPHLVGATDWDADSVLGAKMLAARLYRRRNSPSGVEAFAEAGVTYVSRQDPDVARLLKLNAPRVG